MGDTLDALHRLQAVEIKLAAIRQRREEKVRLADLKRRNFRKGEQRLAERQKAVRDLQARIDLLTLELAAREDATAKHREALNKAKTNKEYAAILTAMNTEKADSSKQETEIQKLTEEADVLRLGELEIQEEVKKFQADLAHSDGVVAAFDKQLGGEVSTLESTRDGLARKIPAGPLSVFQRVAERHEGEALASVVRPNPKREEYSCAGCNMQITLDVLNALRTRDDIRVCQSCGRILYYVEAPAPAQKSGSTS